MPTLLKRTSTINAMDLRREPGRLLDRVYYRKERFVVNRAGEPTAVIVPVQDYQAMQRSRTEARKTFFAMTEELRQAFADEDPKQVEKQITRAVQEVRQQTTPS